MRSSRAAAAAFLAGELGQRCANRGDFARPDVQRLYAREARVVDRYDVQAAGHRHAQLAVAGQPVAVDLAQDATPERRSAVRPVTHALQVRRPMSSTSEANQVVEPHSVQGGDEVGAASAGSGCPRRTANTCRLAERRAARRSAGTRPIRAKPELLSLHSNLDAKRGHPGD